MEPKRSVYMKTLGCQMNDHDSETMLGILHSIGYEQVNKPSAADLILYNTCCVRENPERKLYGHMQEYRALKAAKPDIILGICGCMTQQRSALQTILKTLPHVDLIFGTHNIHRLPELLERALQGEQVVEVWEEGGDIVEDLPVQRSEVHKAYINIIYGCTNFCSYCIVPYTRGRERSRQLSDIVREAEVLAADGVKEIMLLGQNVNAYGRDLPDGTSFSQLLTALNEIPDLHRIRFTTSHPRDMGSALISAMADLDKVCEHLHLPVQSGSSNILQQMNRGYTREDYLNLVHKIKAEIPDIALTTDIIVGFPGETATDHQQTLELVKSVGYSSAFTFLYSPREGTPAAKRTDQVSEAEKKERIYELIEVQNAQGAAILQQEVGQVREVFVEAYDQEKKAMLGRTRQFYQVAVPGPAALVGSFVPVQITSALTWTLRGELLRSDVPA